MPPGTDRGSRRWRIFLPGGECGCRQPAGSVSDTAAGGCHPFRRSAAVRPGRGAGQRPSRRKKLPAAGGGRRPCRILDPQPAGPLCLRRFRWISSMRTRTFWWSTSPGEWWFIRRRGNETRTLVNALLSHCRDSLSGINGVARPGIVHRIDKDTSDLLMVAKTTLPTCRWPRQIRSTPLPASTDGGPVICPPHSER